MMLFIFHIEAARPCLLICAVRRIKQISKEQLHIVVDVS